MKTPRDLLLCRHRSVMPRLDAVRHQVLRECVAEPAEAPDPPRPLAAFLASLWSELFWSCRRVWLGLALAWLVILSLNLAEPPARATSVATAAAWPARERRLAMAEQARLRAELLSSETAAVAEVYPLHPPGPRSERPAAPEPGKPQVPHAA